MASPNGARNEQSERNKNLARQERKIIASFAYGQDGHPDLSYINYADVEVSQDMHDAVIDGIAQGVISRSQEREFLSDIRTPSDFADGAQKTMDRINSRQERRILADMTGVGFYNWQNTSANDIREFLRKYPTPIDFESMAENFLNDIERDNGIEKRREYERSMANFRMAIYGKREEYWQRIKALEDEAFRRNNANIMQHGAAPHANGYRSFEQERSAEWRPGETGFWQSSRAQANGNLVTRQNIEKGLWADKTCEDSYFVRPDQQFYGVFDGAGGHQGSREASSITADVVRECSDRFTLESGAHLAYVLNQANERVANNPQAGISTAVLAKAIRQGNQIKLAYASVGDSRIYIVDSNGNTRQITRDEGEGKYITNAIGDGTENGNIVKQFGEVILRKGDRVVLCSDGVTGDYGDDIMSDRELGYIVSHSRSAQDASKNLLANARKKRRSYSDSFW